MRILVILLLFINVGFFVWQLNWLPWLPWQPQDFKAQTTPATEMTDPNLLQLVLLEEAPQLARAERDDEFDEELTDDMDNGFEEEPTANGEPETTLVAVEDTNIAEDATEPEPAATVATPEDTTAEPEPAIPPVATAATAAPSADEELVQPSVEPSPVPTVTAAPPPSPEESDTVAVPTAPAATATPTETVAVSSAVDNSTEPTTVTNTDAESANGDKTIAQAAAGSPVSVVPVASSDAEPPVTPPTAVAELPSLNEAAASDPTSTPLSTATEPVADDATHSEPSLLQAAAVLQPAESSTTTASEVFPIITEVACFEAGPYTQSMQLDRAAKWLTLQSESITARVQTRPLKILLTWVYLPPLANRQAARQAQTEMVKKNIKDHAIITQGQYNNAISLGLYRDQLSVTRRLRELAQQGYDDVKTEKRYQDDTRYWLDVTIPANQQQAILKRFHNHFSGPVLAVAECK